MHRHDHNLALDGLSWSSEAILFKQAQAGCRACLEHLITSTSVSLFPSRCSDHPRLVPLAGARHEIGALSTCPAAARGRWQANRYSPSVDRGV